MKKTNITSNFRGNKEYSFLPARMKNSCQFILNEAATETTTPVDGNDKATNEVAVYCINRSDRPADFLIVASVFPVLEKNQVSDKFILIKNKVHAYSDTKVFNQNFTTDNKTYSYNEKYREGQLFQNKYKTGRSFQAQSIVFE